MSFLPPAKNGRSIGVLEYWSVGVMTKGLMSIFFNTPILHHHPKAETFKNSWQSLNYLFIGFIIQRRILSLEPPKVRLESNFPYLDSLPRRILCLVDKSYNFQNFIQTFRSENIADIAQGAAEYTGNAFDLDHKSAIARQDILMAVGIALVVLAAGITAMIVPRIIQYPSDCGPANQPRSGKCRYHRRS